MRKNMIALMLLLPILFVLIVYGAVNVSSLNVNISVNGIEIMERYPNDTISIDLANYDDSYEITPVVTPNNASNPAFEYRYELISGSISAEEAAAGGVVEVKRSYAGDRSDRIVANGVGTVRVVAVSKDGSYEDSITVIVGSSKPYALDFAMYNDALSKEDLLTPLGDGYTANVETGNYGYDVKLKPNTHISPIFNITKGFAATDPARGSIVLPFTGDAGFDVVIPGGVNGELIRHVELNVSNPDPTEDDISINGSTANNNTVRFDTLSGVAEFYVQSPEEPDVHLFGSEDDEVVVEVKKIAGVENGYKVIARISGAREGDSFRFEVAAGSARKVVNVNAVDFDFTIRSDMPNFDILNGTNILLGTEISFYAVPIEVSSGVEYKWDFINLGDETTMDHTLNEDGSVCSITAHSRDKFILIVEAYRNGEPIPNIDAKEVEVEVINNVIGATSVDTNVGLAKSLAVPGHKYEGTNKVDNLYAVPINAHSPAGALSDGVNDFDYTLSDNTIARIAKDEEGEVLIDEENDCIFLEIVGKGLVTLTAAWKGNADWRDDDPYELRVPLTVDNEAVEVTTSAQLFAEAEAGAPIVLGADITLGTNDDGSPLSLEQRNGMLKRMKSTYNIEYYKDLGGESEAYVNYVVEFKNDVYGNGHSVSGEYFAHAVDDTETPLMFKGPLYLVNLGGMASVAAQDNIVFLCRTDGVTIFNATLLGCDDSSRTDPDTGMDDLTRLEYVGTVLEINADIDLLNCRVRNGRNVVRIYGGNRDGSRYFVDALSQSTVTSQDRAVVHIEGCVLSHSREFVLKIGTNRALRSGASPNREPRFTDRNANYYDKQGNVYLNDDYFYNSYVMTDVTLADSVLEKSGLFCVGLETNFAGEMLCPDSRFAGGDYGDLLAGWNHVGGTSFPAILRLEGDVRMYDWKDLANVNSDTLIKSDIGGNTGGFQLKLDLATMIDYMSATQPDKVGSIVEADNDSKFVHGGIALYGGGRNYSQVDISGLSDARKNGLKEFTINISDLKGADGDAGVVAQYLPLAAGTRDFRFFMYESTSANDRAWQANANYDIPAVLFR